ncbi:hypothetical protein [Tabrizicola fusiformis]|uniref:hypothetical protein n=1 Tax=Tabrizicola sp. SY72 TaxID=2741673 RepID=UPI0015719AB1|nr:hypothetical protein [Tabrizicola sp. SY72]NTT85723.1 hypothetical protein [Tabrizicola sp. SY72]
MKKRVPAPPPKPDKAALNKARALAQAKARQAILSRLDDFQARHGLSRNAAVSALVQAVQAASQSRLSHHIVQIEGFDLPYAIVRDAKGWNARGGKWKLSRATIYEWISAATASERSSTNPVLPRAKVESATSHDLATTLRFLEQAPDPILDLVVRYNMRRLTAAMKRVQSD